MHLVTLALDWSAWHIFKMLLVSAPDPPRWGVWSELKTTLFCLCAKCYGSYRERLSQWTKQSNLGLRWLVLLSIYWISDPRKQKTFRSYKTHFDIQMTTKSDSKISMWTLNCLKYKQYLWNCYSTGWQAMLFNDLTLSLRVYSLQLVYWSSLSSYVQKLLCMDTASLFNCNYNFPTRIYWLWLCKSLTLFGWKYRSRLTCFVIQSVTCTVSCCI